MQQRDRRTDRDRVEKMQVGAQLPAELDQRASAGVRVVEAPEIEVLPHLSAGDARQQSLGGGGAAGASLVEQGLGVVVAVHELQRGDLLREVRRAGQDAQLTEMPQGRLVAPLAAGCLAGGLYRQGERIPVAAVAGLLDRAGRLPGSRLAGKRPGAGQRVRRAQPDRDQRVQVAAAQGPLDPGGQVLDPSAQPQGAGGFGLDLPDQIRVVDAGQDLVGDGDRLGGVLGPAQYRQAAAAQGQPFRLSGVHRTEGELGEFPRVLGTGAGQGFRRRDQDQGTGKVTGRRRGPGVGGGDQRLTEDAQVVLGQACVQLTRTIAREDRVDRLPDQVVAESQGIGRHGDQPGPDGTGQTVLTVTTGQAGHQRERVAYRQRPASGRDQLHQLPCRTGEIGELARHRRSELGIHGTGFSACVRACQAVDNPSGQERVPAGGMQVAAGPLVRDPPEPVPGHRRQVLRGQRRKPKELPADHVVSGQIDPDGVVAAGEHPHHGPAGQPRQHAAQEEPADPVGPLEIIDREKQRMHGGEVFQAGRDAVSEQQRLADHAGDLLVLSGSGQRFPPCAQRRDHRGTGPDLLDRIALAAADPDLHASRMLTDLCEERGLADTGRPGDHHARAGPVLACTTQRRQRAGHRLASTSQWS